MKLHPATLWLTVLLGSPAWAATPAPVTHATPAKPAAAKPAAAKPVPAATQPRPAPAPSLAPVVEALAGLKVQLLAVSAEVESLKAETAAIKPMFRGAFRKNRVLVPADAFYEWKVVAGKKQPYLIRMRDGAPFGMAGLLERWRGPEGEVQTFAVLTTEANALMAEIHNRMPAIIRPGDYASWLDPEVSDVVLLQGMLGPYPERAMEAYPVSRRVNSPANDGPDLIEPLPAQGEAAPG